MDKNVQELQDKVDSLQWALDELKEKLAKAIRRIGDLEIRAEIFGKRE